MGDCPNTFLSIVVENAPTAKAKNELFAHVCAKFTREIRMDTHGGEIGLQWTFDARTKTLWTASWMYTDVAVYTHAKFVLNRALEDLHAFKAELFGPTTSVRIHSTRELSESRAMQSAFFIS